MRATLVPLFAGRVALDLRSAADLILRDGWAQGIYHDEHGGHCAEGALAVVGQHAARSNRLVEDPAWGPLANGFMSLELSSPAGIRRLVAEDELSASLRRPVSLWNDDPGRTALQVVAAMRSCADRLVGAR